MMNIYRIIEDGQDSLIRASTMQEAVGICLASYLEEIDADGGDPDREITYYHADILESCELLGELKN